MAVLSIRRSSTVLLSVCRPARKSGVHPQPPGPPYLQAVPPHSGSALLAGLPGTGKPLLLVDHVVYVPMGVCHIHCYIPPYLTPAGLFYPGRQKGVQVSICDRTLKRSSNRIFKNLSSEEKPLDM